MFEPDATDNASATPSPAHPPERRWSLARRMTWWFAGTTSTLVLLVAGVSAWAVSESAERELEALVGEELDEMHALFSASDQGRAAFAEIAAELAADHPGNPMAWRVWELASGRPWGEFGDRSLLELAPERPALTGRTLAFGDSLRWSTSALPGQLAMGFMIDGTASLRLSRRFGWIALGFVPLSGLLATLVGALFGRRVAGLLRQVAEGARDLRDPHSSGRVDVVGAPEEIRAVSEALRAMLENIRIEAEGSRLITSGLAHELRSPIQNLLSSTEVALLRDRDPDEYRAVLTGQIEELRDLARAVDNLVTLCAAGETRRVPGVEVFDIGREASLRLEREKAQAQRSGVQLCIEAVGELGITGDREALLLALSNIVVNAIQWSPEGGRVDVHLSGDDTHVELLVDDEGPGIGKERRAEIFLPFHRSDAAHGGRVGFGLGLALAHSAIESHGGKIIVSTSRAGGARFQVSLPRVGSFSPNQRV